MEEHSKPLIFAVVCQAALLLQQISKCQLLSHVQLFVTPCTVTLQALLSKEFSRQEYQNRLPVPSPGIFPTQESNPGLPHCGRILYQLSHQGSPPGSTSATDPFIQGKGSVTLLLQLGRKAQVQAPNRDEDWPEVLSFWQKDCRGNVPFTSHHITGINCPIRLLYHC